MKSKGKKIENSIFALRSLGLNQSPGFKSKSSESNDHNRQLRDFYVTHALNSNNREATAMDLF